MVQLVRHGLDASLRSLQTWVDLACQLGATPPGSPAAATMLSLTYDLFEKLLTAERLVVDQLVASQHQFAQRFFDTTVGGDVTPPVGPSRRKPATRLSTVGHPLDPADRHRVWDNRHSHLASDFVKRVRCRHRFWSQPTVRSDRDGGRLRAVAPTHGDVAALSYAR